MKVLFAIVISATLALGSIALVQDKKQGVDKSRGSHSSGFTMKFEKELNLTAAQKQRINTIYENHKKKVQALQSDTKLTKEAKMQRHKALREDTEKQVMAVLTAQQKQKLDALKKEWASKRTQNKQKPPVNKDKKKDGR